MAFVTFHSAQTSLSTIFVIRLYDDVFFKNKRDSGCGNSVIYKLFVLGSGVAEQTAK